jgi:hypothetical protein
VQLLTIAGFEGPTPVVMKSTVFWNITPFSPLKVYRLFEGMYHLRLQGRMINRATNQRESWRQAGFEVLTAVVMKNSIFWNITLFSPLKVYRRFGGTYRLHLKGQRMSQARNKRESSWQTCSAALKM